MEVEDVRIVVVDDNPDTLEALSILLEMDGYSVETASDSHSALTTIAAFEPICVLTDIDMGGPTGLELASKVRALYGRDITLVAVTGWGESDMRISPAFAHFDYYLRKPVDVKQLKKLLPPVHSTGMDASSALRLTPI